MKQKCAHTYTQTHSSENVPNDISNRVKTTMAMITTAEVSNEDANDCVCEREKKKNDSEITTNVKDR